MKAASEDERAHDDLTAIITTPSSTTARPLLSPTHAWHRHLRPPYAMLALSSVQIALYALLAGATPPAQLLFDPRRHREPWRLLTYMLLHQDGAHLLQNVALQCLFGVYLETAEASWRVLAVYVGGGVGGALGAGAVCSDRVVGASAGVYALLLSNVSHAMLNYSTLKYGRQLIAAVGVIVAGDVGYCAFHYARNASPTISGGAHLFGALHGLLLGLLLFAGGSGGHHPAACARIVPAIALASLALVFLGLAIANARHLRHAHAKPAR